MKNNDYGSFPKLIISFNTTIVGVSLKTFNTVHSHIDTCAVNTFSVFISIMYTPLTPTNGQPAKRVNWLRVSMVANVIQMIMYLHVSTHHITLITTDINRGNQKYSSSNNNSATTSQSSQTSCTNPSVIEQVKDFQSNFLQSDKVFGHGYQFFYGPKLAPFKSKPNLRMLEIGAQAGVSAAGWTQYFDDVFVDMLTYGGNNDEIKFESKACDLGDCSKIHTFYGDQADTDMLHDMMRQRPDGWDIIVDDASHVPEHNIITFEELWRSLKPGGLYIIEDIQTSYWPGGEIYDYPINGGILKESPHNSLHRFKQYADIINRGYWGKANDNDQFSYFPGDHEIEEIGFSRNIIFIKKALSDDTLDLNDHPYHFYPQNPVGAIYHGPAITQELQQAKAIFQEQSKELDSWRTAPSLAN